MIPLDELERVVAGLLHAGDHDEPRRIGAKRAGPVRRVGLALEPEPALAARARDEGLDALVLHRSWGFAPPPGLAVLGAHDAFDARLGPWLAEALGLAAPVLLAPKLLVGGGPPDARERARTLVGGEERFAAGAGGRVTRVAVASAMTDALVRAAAADGAGLYVTGQWRRPGEGAVRTTGLAVQALGHERLERWGLRELARRLAAACPQVVVVPLEGRA